MRVKDIIQNVHGHGTWWYDLLTFCKTVCDVRAMSFDQDHPIWHKVSSCGVGLTSNQKAFIHPLITGNYCIKGHTLYLAGCSSNMQGLTFFMSTNITCPIADYIAFSSNLKA